MIEILGKIGFDWQVALANLVNFIIVFFVLKKFAFEPINKIIKERQNKIDQGLENAKLAETDRMMARELRETELSKAKKEANDIVGLAQQKSNEMVLMSKTNAEKEKNQIIKEGEKEVLEKKEAIKKEAEKEMSILVISGVEKILREKLTTLQQEEYIKKVLNN